MPHRRHALDRAFPPEDFNSFTIGRREALTVLGTTPDRLRRLQADGRLPYRQRGDRGYVWCRRSDLEALLQNPDLQSYLHCRTPRGRRPPPDTD